MISNNSTSYSSLTAISQMIFSSPNSVLTVQQKLNGVPYYYILQVSVDTRLFLKLQKYLPIVQNGVVINSLVTFLPIQLK